MTKMILDTSAIERLPNLKEEVELCDADGKTIGRFLPAKSPVIVPFTEEELDAFEKEDGRPLADILRDLEKL